MTAEQLLLILNLITIVAWLTMICLPRVRWTSTVVPVALPLVLAFIYVVLVARQFRGLTIRYLYLLVRAGLSLERGPPIMERALALAQQALALNDSLPLAHSLLGIVYSQKQQYDQAIAEGERAVALDPNYADSYAVQAEVLNFAGRPEEALQSMEQAVRLNPRYPPGTYSKWAWPT